MRASRDIGEGSLIEISVENLNPLSGAAQTKLHALSGEFDALLARMLARLECQRSKAQRRSRGPAPEAMPCGTSTERRR
jgi:hypothetical protein